MDYKSKKFYEDMDAIVLNLLMKYDDFYMIMKDNHGIHPIDLINSIKRLYRNKKIRKSKYNRIMESMNNKIDVCDDKLDILPVPHMLDYDWRFSLEGLRNLTKKIKENLKEENYSIVFLGAPSLFKYCYLHLPMPAKLILVDINATKHSAEIDSDYVQFINCDLRERCKELEKIHADIVIMDPPWYLNYYQLFFNRAALMCDEGSQVFCIMPPKFTKARTMYETELLIEQTYLLYGLSKKHYYQGIVTYHTPPYEKNVLRVNGIRCIPKNWRVGDLIILEKKNNSNVEFLEFSILDPLWKEVTIKNIRIKYKYPSTDIVSYDIKFEQIFDDDIYPSVKRSYGGKEFINVWTSGNRVFLCNNLPLLDLILCNIDRDLFEVIIEAEYKVPTVDELRKMEMVQQIIKNIVMIETTEYGCFWRQAI